MNPIDAVSMSDAGFVALVMLIVGLALIGWHHVSWWVFRALDRRDYWGADDGRGGPRV